MNTSSDVVTNDIRVRVIPTYIPKRENEESNQYYFSYHVVISNEGNQWVKLLSRHWNIINSDGDKEEISGEGVVGYFPELEPNTSFSYTSYCPIDSDWGTMEGSFSFITKEGTIFQAEIGRFYLIVPDLLTKE